MIYLLRKKDEKLIFDKNLFKISYYILKTGRISKSKVDFQKIKNYVIIYHTLAKA